MSKRKRAPASWAAAETGQSGQDQGGQAACASRMSGPGLPGSLLNSHLESPASMEPHWTRRAEESVLNGLCGVRLRCSVIWSWGQGAAAISLCTFSPSLSESGQTARWKTRAQEGKGNVAASHPLPSLGRGSLGTGLSSDSGEAVGREVPEQLLASGALSTGRNAPERVAPPPVFLPFHLWQQWAMNLYLSFLLFLPPFHLFYLKKKNSHDYSL